MATAEDLAANCRSRVCRRIPHHYNLNCSVRVSNSIWRETAAAAASAASASAVSASAPNSTARVVVGFVGTLRRYSSEFSPYLADFAKHGIVLKKEYQYANPCAFFDDIDVALAWSNPKHTTRRDLFRKPAERFTNPIVLNIPTVGTSALASFRLPGAAPFLRSRAVDVLPLVRRVIVRDLQTEFTRLRANVIDDVAPQRLVERYLSLFAALSQQPPLGLSGTFRGRAPSELVQSTLTSRGRNSRLKLQHRVGTA